MKRAHRSEAKLHLAAIIRHAMAFGEMIDKRHDRELFIHVDTVFQHAADAMLELSDVHDFDEHAAAGVTVRKALD